MTQHILQEIAQAFDDHGDVQWDVQRAAGVTSQLIMRQLDAAHAAYLSHNYGGRPLGGKNGRWVWRVSGVYQDALIRDIIPWVNRKKELLSFYQHARSMLISTSKRGRGAKINDEEWRLRIEVGTEIDKMRKELKG